MRRKFNINWDIESGNLWNHFSKFRILNFPSINFISSDLRTGYKDTSTQRKLNHLCWIDSELYYVQWSVGSGRSGGESWAFHRIYDVDKFMRGEYTFWEMVRDSYECNDYFYMMEFRTSYEDDPLDQRVIRDRTNKYKIPTDSIPRNILPSVSDMFYKKFGKYDVTREQHEEAIYDILNGDGRKIKIQDTLTEIEQKVLLRDYNINKIIT